MVWAMENLNYGLNLTAMGFSHKNKIHDTFLYQAKKFLENSNTIEFHRKVPNYSSELE